MGYWERWRDFTLLSGRHIMVFHPTQDEEPPTTLIQAFIAPDPLTHPPDADVSQLRLTHEMLVGYSHGPICFLRGAIVDATTGDVNIRFLIAKEHYQQTHFLCVDLTLPPGHAASTEVLPIVVKTQELLDLSGCVPRVFFDASDDGYGRGFVITSLLQVSEPLADPHPLALYKFSIDASQDHCIAMASEPTELAPQDVFRYARCYMFDGVRGRVCYDAKPCNRCFDLMVLDIQ